MELNVTIGCSACSYISNTTIKLPYDCDTHICPKCCSENSLFIIKVHDDLSIFSPADIQKRLLRMKKIHITR